MQRTLAVALVLAVCFQATGSVAQVDDKSLKDGQSPQGVRSSTIDKANAQSLKRLKGPRDYPKADEQDVQRWREMKFGLFVHWGPISILGEPIGWSRGGERRGWRGKGHVPVDVYDNLYKQFNPVKFNADEWVQMARDAGMKYLVFVFGPNYSSRFEPVTARHVRLNILKATDGPTIWEFQLFAPKK